MTKKERVTFVINSLKEIYPSIPIPLDHKDPYTLLIAVLLSAQCTDVRVNQITPLLFAKADIETASGSVIFIILDCTQLLVSLFSHKGYTFSHNYGVKDKESQEVVANTPQQAIDLLNELYGLNLDRDAIGDYFKLMEALEGGLSQQDLHAVYDTYLKILDSTRADIPEDLQSYWIDNQERLGLKGKYLPDNSNLTQYKV